jgi:hypothetical protein
MTVRIPRAELTAVAWRHGMDYDIVDDPTAEWVRRMADSLRGASIGSATAADLLDEAAELDALVDRIEREAAA